MVSPALIKDCAKPEIQGNTWRAVGVLAREQDASIKECNTRLKGIREALGHSETGEE